MSTLSSSETISAKVPSFIFWTFALTVLLLPIGLGGNRPIPFGLAQMGLSVCFIGFFYSKNISPLTHFPSDIRHALTLITIILIWAALQILAPVPMNFAHPLWNEAAQILSKPISGKISVDPESAATGLIRLSTYLATGFMAYIIGQSSTLCRRLLHIFWLTGLVLCGYGLAVYSLETQKILWFYKWAYTQDLTSTFVNRNHFAIYAGLVFLIGQALLMQTLREKMRGLRSYQKAAAIKEWLFKSGFGYLLGLLIVLLCIILSHSRSGLILTLVSSVSYYGLFQIYAHQTKKAAYAFWVGGILIIIASVLAIQHLERFDSLFMDGSSLDRYETYNITWRAIMDSPWFGYGINGFQSAFKQYQQGMVMEFQHAHSDWLESLLEYGIPVALLLWASIARIIYSLWCGLRTRNRDGLFPVLGLTASLLILSHAMIDFTLQIPGVVIPWVMLIGIGLAQSRSHQIKSSSLY